VSRYAHAGGAFFGVLGRHGPAGPTEVADPGLAYSDERLRLRASELARPFIEGASQVVAAAGDLEKSLGTLLARWSDIQRTRMRRDR